MLTAQIKKLDIKEKMKISDEYASSPFASEVGVAVLELRLIRIV